MSRADLKTIAFQSLHDSYTLTNGAEYATITSISKDVKTFKESI